MSKIPEDVSKAAYRAIGASFDLHGDICLEIMKERQRCAGLLLHRYDMLMYLADRRKDSGLLLRSTAVEILDLREAILDGAVTPKAREQSNA